MGNTEGTLSELSTDKDNGEVYEDWLMTPGVHRGTNVTVFSASHPHTSRKRPYIERALQASKVYRHPGLLKYIEGGVVGGEVIIVTERATPLHKHYLKHMPALQVAAGLQAVMDTLIFLHDRAGVSHNNVNTTSIFVTSAGLWKLWGLDYSCSFGELTRDHIEHINNYCKEDCIPPDDKTTISHAYQHARDCYAFAKLVDTVLNTSLVSDLPFASDFLNIVKNKAMNKDWSNRMRLATLADHNFFRHDFLQLHHDLTNVLLLPDQQRDTFLQSLALNLKKYPEQLVASTMSDSLLSHPLLLIPSAATHVIPDVLTPKRSQDQNSCGLFSEELYKSYVIPPLLHLYSILDVTVRTILLTYLPQYIALIPKEDLQNDILPLILLGIKDTSDALVEATLQSLAHLVPILGADIVIGSNRHQIFTIAKPKALTLNYRSDLNSTLGKKDSLNLRLKGDKLNIKTSRPILIEPKEVDVNSLDNLDLDNISISQIPERSSPDGGEDETGSPLLASITNLTKDEETDVWSDWEELQDTKSYFNSQKNSDVSVKTIKEMPTVVETRNAAVNTVELSNVSENKSKSRTSQGFGEEYDIMAIKVKKRHDTELDLFADIMPQFQTKKFDLESMLEDANSSNTDKHKVPSVSATLARLDSETIAEGEGWGVEDNWEEQNVETFCNNDVFTGTDITEEESSKTTAEETVWESDNWK